VRVLDITTDAFVASRLATALAQLRAIESLPKIERVLSEFAESEHAGGIVGALARFHEPSSLDVLKEVLGTNIWIGIRHAIIGSLGAYLPDPWARQTLIQQLDERAHRNVFSGAQQAAVRALVAHDPNCLLENGVRLYDAGCFDLTARVSLARYVTLVVGKAEVDRRKLLSVLKRLICDRSLAVRELTAQGLALTDDSIVTSLYTELRESADDWARASAVFVLGCLEGTEDRIQTARFDEAFIIRHSADKALETLCRRRALKQLVEQYQSQDGVERLSAYIAICQSGDEHTIHLLYQLIREADPAHIFLRELGDHVAERVNKERNKREEEEQELLNSGPIIRFD
jgi:hypothetical protein